MKKRLTMLALALAFMCISARTASATIRYVSPTGSGTSCTNTPSGTPCSFATARSASVPGDSIIVKNGTYTPWVITCGSNANDGTSGSGVITVTAENERQAWLAGNGAESSAMLHITNCSYWTFIGLHASTGDCDPTECPSGGWDPVDVFSSDHLIFRRMIVDHNNRGWNSQLMLLDSTNDSLVEESEFYTFHRNGLVSKYGSRNTFRRNYMNSRFYPDDCPCPPAYASAIMGRGDGGFSIYPGSNNIVENNISEDGGSGFEVQPESDSTGNQFLGDISRGDYLGMNIQLREGRAINTTVRDFVTIAPQSVAIYSRGAQNTQIVNTSVFNGVSNGVIADDPFNPPAGTRSFFATNTLSNGNAGPGFSIGGQNSFLLNYTTATGNGTNYSPAASDPSITNEFTSAPTSTTCYLWQPDGSNLLGAGLSGQNIGARILYRYEDGALTSIPLWDADGLGVPDGVFPHGATVTGLNDQAGVSLFDIQSRLRINTGGCSFPSLYDGGGGGGGGTSSPLISIIFQSPVLR